VSPTFGPSSVPTVSLPTGTPSGSPSASFPSASPTPNSPTSGPSQLPSFGPQTSAPSGFPSKLPSNIQACDWFRDLQWFILVLIIRQLIWRFPCSWLLDIADSRVVAFAIRLIIISGKDFVPHSVLLWYFSLKHPSLAFIFVFLIQVLASAFSF